MSPPEVVRIAAGAYRVEHDGRAEIVYVAGSPSDRWAFWNGRVFRGPTRPARSSTRGGGPSGLVQPITAPMPATVIKVLVEAGASVKKGDTVLILEAMKMELPLRSPADAVVKAVHCRERELVQPDTVLVELE